MLLYHHLYHLYQHVIYTHVHCTNTHLLLSCTGHCFFAATEVVWEKVARGKVDRPGSCRVRVASLHNAPWREGRLCSNTASPHSILHLLFAPLHSPLYTLGLCP